jgi:hypothetical protein
MFGWLRSSLGIGSAKAADSGLSANVRGMIRAAYDNARTHAENIRNWSGTDYLSARAANDWQVRRTLRTRSRHEVSNNPFLFGVVNDNADDLIDVGPTLQVTTTNKNYNRTVEGGWSDWFQAVDGTEKIRTAKLAKTIDGEGILVLKTVPDLDANVQLYPVDLEADQMTTPFMGASFGNSILDGITLHPITQRPISYSILRAHPGDNLRAQFRSLRSRSRPRRSRHSLVRQVPPGPDSRHSDLHKLPRSLRRTPRLPQGRPCRRSTRRRLRRRARKRIHGDDGR